MPVAGNEVVTDMPAPPATSAAQTATPPTQGEARKDAAAGETGGMRLPAAGAGARPTQPAEVARQAAPAAPMTTQPEAGTVPPGAATLPEPFPAATPKRDGPPPPAVAKPGEPRPVPSPKREAVAMADAPPLAAALGKLASEPGPATLSAPAVAPGAATDSEPPRPAPHARVAAAAPRLEAAADARAKDRAPLPVAEWIALIRRLRAEGKIDDSARELAAFRTAHADHERLLPADLREWRPPAK